MIERLHLRNFKSFSEGTVSFAPLTLILGANGVGKSNLFDALRLLKAVGEGRSIRDAIEGHTSSAPTTSAVPGIRGGGADLPTFDSGSSNIELEVQMRIGTVRVVYGVCIDTIKYRVVREELKSNGHPGTYVFSTHPDTGPLEQRDDSPAIVARFHKETPGVNPRREFSPYEFILSQFRDRRAESRVNESVAELARRELASIRPLELRPEVLRQYSPLGRFELGEHGENFAAVVWQLLQDVDAANMWRQVKRYRKRQQAQLQLEGTGAKVTPEDDITLFDHLPPEEEDDEEDEPEQRLAAVKAWLSDLTPRAVTGIAYEQAPTGEVIFAITEEGHADPISARSLSDGTLRFAALTMAALGTTERQTLVVEEVENGINPTRLALLIRMLERTTELDGEVQVIASTHSPGFLDFASEEARQNAVIIGWDSERRSSHPVRLGDLPDINAILESTSLGTLQGEGWLQLAADI